MLSHNHFFHKTILIILVLLQAQSSVFADTEKEVVDLDEKIKAIFDKENWYDPFLFEGGWFYKVRVHHRPGKQLAALGHEVVPILINMLHEYRSYGIESLTILYAFRHLGDDQALPHIISMLQDNIDNHIDMANDEPIYEILYFEAVDTIASFSNEVADAYLYELFKAEAHATIFRAYAAGHLASSNDTVKAEQARDYLYQLYKQGPEDVIKLKNDNSYSQLLPYPILISYWRLNDTDMQRDILNYIDERGYGLGGNNFILDLMEESDKRIIPWIMGILGPRYEHTSREIPLLLVEHILEYYDEGDFPIAWLKEMCLSNSWRAFHGYDYYSVGSQQFVERWIAIRHALFPELPAVVPVLLTQEEAPHWSNIEGVYTSREGNLLTVDPETGMVTNFPKDIVLENRRIDE